MPCFELVSNGSWRNWVTFTGEFGNTRRVQRKILCVYERAGDQLSGRKKVKMPERRSAADSDEKECQSRRGELVSV